MKKGSGFSLLGQAKAYLKRLPGLLTALLLFAPLTVSAQDKVININKRGVPVKEVFADIQAQTGLSVVYNVSDLNPEKNVTVNADGQSLESVMNGLLINTGLTYTVRDNHVVISRIAAQPRVTVTGTVTEPDGKTPIIGATVVVHGLSGEMETGVSTGLNGEYSISAVVGETLHFSYLGYEPVTRKVGTETVINVSLQESATAIDQIVVTGMMQVDKRLFAGATDKLSAEKVKLDGISDISRSLEGRSAGVSVQNVSGTFGSAPKIRIRGATSIYGASKPLWVVDGVILEDVVDVSADDLASGDVETLISSSIAGLNTDDIQDIQILKDGSATSIYGARAMAGVIVVTTKRGRPGVTSISYTGEYTYRLKPSYSEFNIMNSQDQMSIYEEMYAKGWLNFSDQFRASNSGIYGKLYHLQNTYNPLTGTFYVERSEKGRREYLRTYEMMNTDWFDQLFNNNVSHSHSVSLSTGSDKASAYASLSALDDPGWTKQSKVSRYTLNFNGSMKLFKNLTLNILGNASFRNQRAPGTLSAKTDAVYGTVSREFDINPYSYAVNSSRTLDPSVYYQRNYAPFNIQHELRNNYIDLDVLDMRYQGELKWGIIKGLDFSFLGALQYSRTSQEHRILGSANQALAYRAMGDSTIRDNNQLLYRDPDDPYALPISVLPEGGMYYRTDRRNAAYSTRAALTYNTIIADDHIINFYAASEINSSDRRNSWFEGWGLQYDMGETPFYIYQYFKQGIEKNNRYYSMGANYLRSAAFFSNLIYSYKGKYSLQGTIRYEGSNQLGRSRSARWLPTWNVSAGWNVHEENFFESLKPVMSMLKFRVSYSLAGNRGPSWLTNSLVVLGNYTPYRPFTGIQESGISIGQLENKDLTYEKKHEFNFGFDAGFLDNRINLSFDIYSRNNYDLIGPAFTQGIGGQISKYANIAEMKSHGVEFSISSENIRNTDFSWSTDFIFSYGKNEITKFETNSTVMTLVSGAGFTMKGYPNRALFSIPFLGLNEQGLPVFRTPSGGETVTGINFQGLDVSYLKYEGPTEPIVNGSLGNMFRYKNLRLNVFMTYAFGHVVRLDPVFSAAYNDLTAMPKEFKNRWMLPGDQDRTDIPVLLPRREYVKNASGYVRAYNAYNYSDARIAKGDFIRMKEISVTYDFPKKLLGNTLSNLSVKLQATNLFLIYADKKQNGQDPEFFSSGGVATPVPKQFTMTLRIGF